MANFALTFCYVKVKLIVALMCVTLSARRGVKIALTALPVHGGREERGKSLREEVRFMQLDTQIYRIRLKAYATFANATSECIPEERRLFIIGSGSTYIRFEKAKCTRVLRSIIAFRRRRILPVRRNP
jgi:hypothetical protein